MTILHKGCLFVCSGMQIKGSTRQGNGLIIEPDSLTDAIRKKYIYEGILWVKMKVIIE